MLDGRAQIKRRAGWRLWLSGGWLGFLALAALLAPWISPQDPLAQDLFTSRLPPFWMAGAEPGYWLGSDSLGRDVLSRILYGARVALAVALIAGTATCLIGGVIMWVFISDLRFQADAALLLVVMLLLNASAAMLLVPAWIRIFKPTFVSAARFDEDGVLHIEEAPVRP